VRIARALLLVCALGIAAWALPAPASGAVVGSHRVGADPDLGFGCLDFPCAYAQTRLPAPATARSPIDGRLRRWRVHVADVGAIRLVVLHKRRNGRFVARRVSSPHDAVAGVNVYGSHLRIRRGDFIGIEIVEELVLGAVQAQRTRNCFFDAAFARGTSLHPVSCGSGIELLFNATVRRPR
jgi:hypothetical protein